MPGRGVWMKKCRRIKGSWLLVVDPLPNRRARSNGHVADAGIGIPAANPRAPVSAGVGELLLGSAADERLAEAARRFSGEVPQAADYSCL